MIQTWSLSEIASLTEGRLVLTDPQELLADESKIKAIVTDSRKIKAGDLFVALNGERFRGADFVPQAQAQGAIAAVVDEAAVQTLSASTMALIVVKDTLQALGQMSRCNRRAFQGPVIAVTGSNGKTTVKEMIASILRVKGPACATQGNFNNRIGVPLSLLTLTPEHQSAIFELGASEKGEIQETVHWVEPHVSIINNVSACHVEGFGSLDDIASAKGEILSGLSQDGAAVLNADSPYFSFWQEKLLPSQRLYSFAHGGNQGTVCVKQVSASRSSKAVQKVVLTTPVGDFCVQLSLFGHHNAVNCAAATAACLAVDIPISQIQDGLEQMQPVPGRLFWKKQNNRMLIDDSYNANGASVCAAIDVLINQQGRKLLILGDMAELGAVSDETHQQVASYAATAGVDILFTVGVHTQISHQAFLEQEGGYAQHFHHKDALKKYLLANPAAFEVVLIKGSNSAGLGEMVSFMSEHWLGES